MLTPDQARDRAAGYRRARPRAPAPMPPMRSSPPTQSLDGVGAARRAGGCRALGKRRARPARVRRAALGERLDLRSVVATRSTRWSSARSAMAREAPEDQWAGLAPAERLLHGTPAAARSRRWRRSVARSRCKRRGARRRGCGARRRRASPTAKAAAPAPRARCWALATSHGFAGAYAATGYGLSASVLAGEGGGMERDYAHHSARATPRCSRRPRRSAGGRASARSRGSIRASSPSGAMPVVFDPRVGARCSAISSARSPARRSRARPASCSTRSAPQVFAPGVTIARRSAPPARPALAAVRRRGAAGVAARDRRTTACWKPGCSTAPRRASSGWSRPAMPRAASAARRAWRPATSIMEAGSVPPSRR